MTLRAGAGVIVLVLTACGDRRAPPPPIDLEPGPVPAELAGGERLFKASCEQCHGALALGTERGPPLVHPYYEPNHHADVAFQRAVALGVPAHHWDFGPMPKVEGLSPEDVSAITAYVRWLQRAAGIY